MEKPNMMESLEPHSGQYSFKTDLKLNAWLGVAVVVYLATLWLNSRNPDWSALVRGLIALTPLLPGLLYIRSWVRFTRGCDELQRRIQSEAFLFASIGTVVVGAAIGALNTHGVPTAMFTHGLGIGGSFMLMLFLWSVGWALAKCRYK
ncbi:MAG TPA: hypothetical protein VMM36_14370 [Opitutaceae bacterium]|nr:hypothetical protein [Opitutaceae bacterium]